MEEGEERGKACELGVGDRVEVTWNGSRLRSEETSSGRQKETDLRGEAGSKPKNGATEPASQRMGTSVSGSQRAKGWDECLRQ